jgi:glycosyltransferase involved in cell wall biosynthesis
MNENNLPLCVIQGPYATRSGYGDFARDIIRHIIDLKKFNVKLVSMGWGACPMNALESPKDDGIITRTLTPPFQLPRQPELFIQISVPNEFHPQGKYNIGITAGIETTLISKEWVDGCNRMDVIFTISEFSKQGIIGTIVKNVDQQGNVREEIKVTKPVEVLHNCVHTDVFKRISPAEVPATVKDELDQIEEQFCYLFVGHWLKGNFGEDRKNIAVLIKIFGETFKQLPVALRPALILKTSGAGFSLMDQIDVSYKIRAIKETIGPDCPSIYLLHGDLSEVEMNGLYNHPKVKAHISFTKGEGFGRPLLEASVSGKPVIASNWSGHLDFLTAKNSVLVDGEVRQVEAGAVWPGVIIAESGWFNVDPQKASNALLLVRKNYEKYKDKAAWLTRRNSQMFSYEQIRENTKQLLEKYVPKFAISQQLKLPTLKRVAR